MKKARERQNIANTLRALKEGEKIRVNGRTYEAKGWKSTDVSKKVGKRKWVESQINYARAIEAIEAKLGKVSDYIRMNYGSDDVEELANQYWVAELSDYTPEELRAIEEEFSKTHGFGVRLEKAENPFTKIDFLNM